MTRCARMLAPALLGSLLAGCATSRLIPLPAATGNASWQLAVPKDTVRYQLAMGEISSGGTPIQRVAPRFDRDRQLSLISCKASQANEPGASLVPKLMPRSSGG